MKTSDSGNRGKMSKIDTFQFEAVDSKIVDDIAREEEQRLNRPSAPARGQTPPPMQTAEREYRFYTTNSVKRMDTQTVNRMMTTSSLAVPGAPTGRRKPMTGRRAAAMLIPLCIIIAYIFSLVAVDILGLCGYYFRMTAISIVLYVLYICLSLLGVVLLMFMDMLPKPLALLVTFVSMFCVHGNLYLMIPLIAAFIAIGITVEGTYPRIAVCAVTVFMAFYAVVIGVNNAKITRSEPKLSSDGEYQLVLESADDGHSLSYALLLETTGTLYKKYSVQTGYVDLYYFGEGHTVAYGEANKYGQPDTIQTKKIKDILKKTWNGHSLR